MKLPDFKSDQEKQEWLEYFLNQWYLEGNVDGNHELLKVGCAVFDSHRDKLCEFCRYYSMKVQVDDLGKCPVWELMSGTKLHKYLQQQASQGVVLTRRLFDMWTSRQRPEGESGSLKAAIENLREVKSLVGCVDTDEGGTVRKIEVVDVPAERKLK